MARRQVRIGIDVGGTYTKAVAIDNATHEIIGKSSIKTTHDDPSGVAAGVVITFQNVLKENNIRPEDVIFVAHSTTQATNALVEGDVANVGIMGVAQGGLEGLLAKNRSISMTSILRMEKRFAFSIAFLSASNLRMSAFTKRSIVFGRKAPR